MKSTILGFAITLLCIATHASAAPMLTFDLVRNLDGNPVLDANGDYQWAVVIAFDEESVAGVEVSFNVTGGGTDVLAAVNGDPSIWDRDNPGAIPGSLNPNIAAAVQADRAANNSLPSDAFNAPDGIVSASDGVFAALGSNVFPGPQTVDMLSITTAGPSTTAGLTTELTSLGAFSGLTQAGGSITGGDRFNIAVNGRNNLFDGVTVSYTALEGDVNLDGTVDEQDQSLLFANLNQPGNWNQGDLDGNGQVNMADVAIFQQSFNPVPEPTSLLLAVATILGIGITRRRA